MPSFYIAFCFWLSLGNIADDQGRKKRMSISEGKTSQVKALAVLFRVKAK